VFGSVRPSAIVFDWILGGLAPVAALVASFAVGDAGARSALRWTALGLYGGTRVGVLVIGNLHISEYDNYLQSMSLPQFHHSGNMVKLTWSW
jgi:hypothetical protein